MSRKLKHTQKLNTTLQMTQAMQNSLNVLKMNQNELIDFINDTVNNNPMIEYIPSSDMHQLIQDTISTTKSLKDDLYLQLHTCNEDYNNKVASFIIESLDENGFLTESMKEYARILKVPVSTIEQTLLLLQSFEPVGVAAKDSIDSVKIQLIHKKYHHAYHIFTHYKNEIIQNDYKEIASLENLSVEEVKSYIRQIQTCTPNPCISYNTYKSGIIIPDFTIQVEDKNVIIIPKDIGHIQIYEKTGFKNESIIAYFNEAHFFIDYLNKRNKTLLLLVNALVDIQKSHFLYQDELESCTLKDIATLTGFHESTVSRALSNKYYEFENELYPVKSLFTSKTKDGTSKDSLMKSIHQLIINEDPYNPLSDEQIVNRLEMVGLYVSRRAVNKYRKLLNIPNSKQRKKNI